MLTPSFQSSSIFAQGNKVPEDPYGRALQRQAYAKDAPSSNRGPQHAPRLGMLGWQPGSPACAAFGYAGVATGTARVYATARRSNQIPDRSDWTAANRDTSPTLVGEDHLIYA